jgi:ABC-type phosphate transport system substrate-binding protein
MWLPAITGEEGRPITVENASQVEVEIRHIGSKPIQEDDFRGADPLRVHFPGRRVMDCQARPKWLLDPALGGQRAPEPGVSDELTLPPLPMNTNTSIAVEVLLKPGPEPYGESTRPKVTGFIVDGGGEVKRYSRRWRRRWAAVAVVGMVGLVASVVSVLASRGSSPGTHPVSCVSGNVSFKGSTAFAPIVNEVAGLYEQACSKNRISITVRAIGSGQGLAELTGQKSGGQFVAMYDGKPPLRSVCGRCRATPVGVIIFAVVGNRHLWPSFFKTGYGMSRAGITRAFENPEGEADLLHVRWVDPVGRTTVSWRTRSGRVSQAPSGTRLAFAKQVLRLGGYDTTAENNAGLCPAANENTVCLANTTMGLLAYANSRWYSIGYAEADALLYFPNVGAIPINGVLPTRANALNGSYPFVATEYLYTQGRPTGLAAAFINFLKSSTVTAELRRGHSFIACSDLGRSALRGRCGADHSRP